MPDAVTPEALFLPPTFAVDLTAYLDDVTDRVGDDTHSREVEAEIARYIRNRG